jgi:bacterioferritin-associated ferredoxin
MTTATWVKMLSGRSGVSVVPTLEAAFGNLSAVAIVCQCFGVSDRKVARAVECGAATVEEIGQQCGAGTMCGGCHPNLQAALGPVSQDAQLSPAW